MRALTITTAIIVVSGLLPEARAQSPAGVDGEAQVLTPEEFKRQAEKERSVYEQELEDRSRKNRQRHSDAIMRRLNATKEGTIRVEARIESYVDGTIMVSSPCPKNLEPLLLKFGHVRAMAPPTHTDRVIFKGRAYHILPVSEGISEFIIKDKLGRDVELELVRFVNGAPNRVVRIRDIGKPPAP